MSSILISNLLPRCHDPIQGHDGQIGTVPSKPTLDLSKENRIESPLYLGLFPNKDPLPAQTIQAHKIIGDLGILRMHPTAHNIGILNIIILIKMCLHICSRKF